MALIPPFFLDCVVAIGSRRGDNVQWSASGFLYGHFVSTEGDQSRFAIYLITNRHVFDRASEVVLRFNPEGSDPAREVDLALLDANGTRLWLAHPDPEIDAAVISINGQGLQAQNIQFAYFRSHQHVLDRQGAVDKGLSEGDGAYILGFPMGIVGGDRSYVIVRQGALARVRDWLAGTSKEFLVDATIFPGNSGGPVVNRPENTAIRGTQQQNAAYLVGIVKSYVSYSDIAVSQQTGRPRVIFEENSGLAAVVPMEYIMEVIEAHRATLGTPPTAEEPSLAPEEAPPDAPAAKPVTSPVTAIDLMNGRIRIPESTKPILPATRTKLPLRLRAVDMMVPYDPGNGPRRRRSGVIRIGKRRLAGLVQPGERLRVSKAGETFVLD